MMFFEKTWAISPLDMRVQTKKQELWRLVQGHYSRRKTTGKNKNLSEGCATLIL